ncbi:hypothetical protein BDW60DRAFT_222676 [Aspergillus nidulans var. acristatus]
MSHSTSQGIGAITPAEARLIETAETTFITAQIDAGRRVYPEDGFLAQSIGGGVAAVTKASFGRKLNHVAGIGMERPVTDKDIDDIERLFKAIGVQPEINLCPFAHNSAVEVLKKRGYMICAEMNVYALSLQNYEAEDGSHREEEYKQTKGNEIHITPISKEDHALFIQSSTTGFASAGSLNPDLFHTLATIATLRPDTRLYFAKIDGKIAGTAGLALITTSLGKVAELYIDSTLPEFRGRGVQVALLRARLAEAKREGCAIAAVTTWPGGVSARNMERVGFKLAYRKDVFTPGSPGCG